MAPPVNAINRQEVAMRSTRSSNDDGRVPDNTDPARRPTNPLECCPPILNVGEDPFDGDAVVSEPCDGAFEHADRGDCLLVRADLDVGDAGVIVEHGVQERGADVGMAFLGVSGAGAGGALLVLLALLLAHVSPAAAVGDVPNLVTSTWIIAPGWSCS